MSNDLSRARSLSPEEKRALLESLLRKEPTGSRVAPLSFAQQRLWFLEELEDTGTAYHIPLRLHLAGALDAAALRRALDRIVARHEVLRTTFGQVDGKPVQRIAPAGPDGFGLAAHDLRGAPDPRAALAGLVAREAETRFDLAAGPLIRGSLVALADDEHVLLVTMHHIVSDGWSLGVFGRELSTLYDAFRRGEPDPLPALATQYADYAAWQRRRVAGELLERQASYWERTLAGAPELLELPTDHPRPRKQDFAGDVVPLELDAELSAALKALSRRHGTTLFMTLLAGWAVVLSRLSGQTDVVVGTPTAGRERREIEDLIGFFVHTLALRVDLSEAPTVAELLRQVRARALEAQQHQDIPFEQVVERVRPARSLAYTPLFQVLLAWQEGLGGGLGLPGLRSGPVEKPARDGAKYDLRMGLWEKDGRIAGTLAYATSLFDRATVERHLGYLRRALEEMAADDGRRVDRLALMPADEHALVVEAWNRTEADYPAGSCLHELFEAQVARTPDAAAVVFAGERLTYAELNADANRLAHHLRSLGVGPGVRVGLCLERGPAMVTGLLGVLKAGGVFVPLDPGYPGERLAYMLADSAPAAVLTRKGLRDRVGSTAVPVLELDAPAPAWADAPATNPERGALTPAHPAYVTFTSGSTGRPKGVPALHHKVLNLVHWYGREFGITGRDAVLLVMSFSFDATYRNVFAPLFAGGELHLAGEPFDPSAIVAQIAASGIRVVSLTPTAFQALAEADRERALSGVRTVLLVGEPVQPRVLLELPEPRPELVNLYGPTECSGAVAYHRLSSDLATYLRRPVPVGRPVANARLYVLDAAGSPVPVGVAGELHVGGTPVGPGYQNRPDQTAERFVADPFGGEPGARMYRTGDRARWRSDGTLEFLGRVDFQVKVRGYRIEPGEIEARLREHPSVREAVVMARDDGRGEPRLVAYVAADDVDVEALRAHLSARLPEYMVPAAYVRLDALPLTPSRKLDRRALPAPEGDAFAARGYEAPSGPAEDAVAAIWAELLGVERVGRGDHFFALGGHSLLAVRVVSRVRQALGVEASPGDVFERPVLADFARGLTTAARAEGAAIGRVDRAGKVPLSFAQQRLWFLEQLGGMGAAYHIPMRMRLRGGLDRVALVRALDRIVARHEALRTTFPVVDGEPVQHIAPAEESAFRLVEHDLHASAGAEDELRRLARDEAGAPFDLAHGPLVRGRLVRMAADDHVLLLTMHHVVSDVWSAGVLQRELGVLYTAFVRGQADPLAPLAVQYADYAAWHRAWVDGPVLEAQAEYWTQTLAGAPELLELPADHPRPARQDFAGAWVDVELDEALTAALKTLGQRHGATLYMTLLAGWAAVLARLSGQDDVVIGTPSANRGWAEVEELIGFFVNTLPLRVDLSGGPRVGELLERVKGRALDAQRNQDIPFEQVVERVRPARSLAHSPLFQVMFAWQNAPGGAVELPGLTVGGAGLAGTDTAKFDLSLALWERDGRIVGGLTYATALFERATAERFTVYLRRALEAMAKDEHGAVHRLPLLPEAERRLVVEGWNATDAAYPAGACIHQLFEAQVERTPDAPAVAFEGRPLSYARLNARANRLAHHLAGLGVGPDVRVAICVERSPEMVVALLATLKAGGAYVPLDPEAPQERLRAMLADCAPAVLLTQAALLTAMRGRFGGAAVPVLAVDADVPAWAAAPETNPRPAGLTPDHLAYVIYTSGSTGTPKGVMNAHRGVVNRLAWMERAYRLEAGEAVLQKTPYGFDVSVWEFFWPLATGARLVMARPGGHRDPGYLAATIRAEGITTLHFVPSMLRAFLDAEGVEACASTLRRVVCSGEALPAALVRRFDARLPGVELHNLYGPTEAAVDVTAWPCAASESEVVPIGRPMANVRVYLLDAGMAPVPVGVAGELYIGGIQVARGYLNRAGLTAERFVPDPFGAGAGARLYRTGDLARWRADGSIEYLGRNDFQVKVRGFRIEPGEIEARLAEHPSVRAAVVVARDDGRGEARLVAYVAADGLDVEALRAHLSARLPEHMVPAAYVRLDALPLTASGKLDRRALPAPEGDAYARRGHEAPAGETEQALAEIWAEVLDVERVGRGDHFFELGGHSLLAVRVVSRIRQALGVEASLGDVFERPVLADFARGLTTAARAEGAAIERVDRAGTIPLSFAQQRLWFLEQLGGMGSAYHVPMRMRLRGDLDRVALVRALDRIVARHEALRTTFPVVDGEPVQRIASAEESAFRLVEHDLHASAGAEDALRRVMSDETTAPFDLAHGPLVRGRLVRMAADDHVLLLTMHHVVSDGWSAGVLQRELGALYTAFARGGEDPLPPLPVQYADYAAWHRRWADGPVLEAQAEYWTETLAGAPELLELPADRPRPARQDFAGGSVDVELDPALTAALKSLGQRHGTTLFMTLLAGWAAVLARLSGQDDVVIGTPSANRGRAEVEGLIGFFVNTLPIRVDLSGEPRVAELLERVKGRALEAQRNQDIPFEQVVERVRPARSLAHSPLFQVMFAWQNAPGGALELPGLTVGGAGVAEASTAKFDLSLALWERDGRIVGGLTYAAALFERATAERFTVYLRRALEAMAADEHGAVHRLPLLPDAERRMVVEEWNRTAEVPGDACIHARFEAQVERTPGAAAVVFGGESLTYAALNARANRLAHHLVARGVGPDVPVAICVERSLEMVVGLLAVLKAGGGYVPLDPGYPDERLRYTLADARPALLLTQAALRERFADLDLPVLAVDANAPSWAGLPETNPGRADVEPRHLAYAIYTSGSTGQPKGVMVEHRNVARLFTATDAWFGFGPDDVWTLFHSFAFDFSVWEIWGALLYGGRLVVVPPEVSRSPEDFYALLCREGVTVLNQTPSAFRQLIAAQASSNAEHRLRYVVFGGEALELATLRPWFARNDDRRTRLVNMYGITETTVHVTYRPVVAADAERAGPSPIGVRIPDLKTYVLDAYGQPVPVGVAGELYVGGAGVARGYLDRPELTAERFVRDPFSTDPHARLYRTGDLGRWLADGTLEYLGRNDHQVKIRGFRIELGEIEARLLEHPGVREAVVLAREGGRLAAWYVGAAPLDVAELRAQLGARLPEYMVPAAYVHLERLPLTPNGKVDQKALPAPDEDAYARREYEAPVGETEQALAEIWSELLGVERVGRHDHFFELGGHSLLIVKLLERMRRRGLHAEVGTLFTTPVLARLAEAVSAHADEVAVAPNAIPSECEAITPGMLPLVQLSQADVDRIVAGVEGGAANVQDIYPLAPLQEGILFHHLLKQDRDPYLLPFLYSFERREQVDAYVAALQAVIDRHDILRTAVTWESLPEPVQVVWRRARLRVEEVELDAAEGDAEKALWDRFDPRRTRLDVRRAPLMRAVMAHDAAEGRWLLLLQEHHLIIDGTTREVLQAEIRAHLLGREAELPAPLPFRNHVAQARAGASHAEHEAFFRGLLGDVQETTAPFGLLDVWSDGSDVEAAWQSVEAGLQDRLRARARALGVSAASVCHVAWGQVLARVTGRDDVVFGTVLFGRMQGGEGTDRVMGLFANTLPVRVRVGGAGAEASVRAMHQQLARLVRHEHASLGLAQRSSGVEAPAPLFTSFLNYRYNARPGQARSVEEREALDGMRRLRTEDRSNYPVGLAVNDAGEALSVTAQAPASVGAARVCALMHRALEALVEALETAPERAVGTLDVLPAEERRRVVEEWNRTEAPYPDESCLHELFEAQVERTPRAVAVLSDDGPLTYAQLNARANRLAYHLRALGVRPDARVAICVERGLEMVAAVLGVLKAGGAYVPLDPAYPEERLRYMLEDSAPVLLLTQSSLAGPFAGADVPRLCLDAELPARAGEAETNPARGGLTPGHLAYVIYTSGSTGRPKGVMVQHRGGANLVTAQVAAFGVEPESRVLQFASFSFDACVSEVLTALCRGAALHLPPRGVVLAGDALVRALAGITHATLPPAVLAALPGDADLASVRTLVLAGDVLPEAVAKRWAPGRRLINAYGPTEATVCATLHEVRGGEAGSPPIGRPLANARVYVLDRTGEPVPVGVAGELYVGGAGVARGYLDRPALTAERFVPDPFGAPGARLYRTGDLARWRADGTVDFLGRNDFQVKIRGFRIELGEIEGRLAEHPAVREAVVVAREEGPGDPRLVAYWVGEEGAEAEALRAHLGEQLPEHMVPAAYVRLETLPLTPSGKLDRKALPSPEGEAYARRGYEAPADEVEEALAEIWSELLGVERVGRWDDFFDLGGHSLVVVLVISRVRQVLDVELEPGKVFELPVLASLAEWILELQLAQFDPEELARLAGTAGAPA